MPQGKYPLCHNDQQRYNKGAPKGADHAYNPAEKRDWVHVPVAHRRHRDDRAPESPAVRVEIPLVNRRVVLTLEHAQAVGQDQHGNHHGEGDCPSGLYLEQALVGETNVGGEAVVAAELFGHYVGEHVVVEDGAHDKEEAEEHEDEDEVAQQVVNCHVDVLRARIDELKGEEPVIEGNGTDDKDERFAPEGEFKPRTVLETISFDLFGSINPEQILVVE